MNVVDQKTRSKIMSAVRSKGNKSTEMAMMKLLRNNRLKGWRRHLPIHGKPDFSWQRLKIALFVDGCFWYGCPRCYRAPTSNTDYWEAKVKRNRSRDRKVSKLLRNEGWSVIRVWECRIHEAHTLKRIARIINRKADTVFQGREIKNFSLADSKNQ